MTQHLFLHDQILVGGFVLGPSTVPGLNFQQRVQSEDEDDCINLKGVHCILIAVCMLLTHSYCENGLPNRMICASLKFSIG